MIKATIKTMTVCLTASLLGGCMAQNVEPLHVTVPPVKEAGISREVSPASETLRTGWLDATPYIGEFQGIDGSALQISWADSTRLCVNIGLLRLTDIDDGIGALSPAGLAFTATDAAGNPIGGVIVSDGDTATLTFTDSSWEYLPEGTVYRFTRNNRP